MANPEKRGIKRGLKIAGIALLSLIALTVAAAVGLRAKYNDEFLRQTLERQINENSPLTCQIGEFKLSLLSGRAELRDINLRLAAEPAGANANPVSQEIVKIKSLAADIAIGKSLLARGAYFDATLADWDLLITRDPRRFRGKRGAAERENSSAANRESSGEQTTNIQQTLDQLRNLPWENYLKNLDLLARVKSGAFTLKNGKVTLRDNVGLLGDCELTVEQIVAAKRDEHLAMTAQLQLQTPQVASGGRLNFDFATNIAPRAEGLKRLVKIKVNLDLENFDAPYISRYYNLGFRLRRNYFTLGAPFSGKIRIAGESLAETLALDYQLATARLAEIFPADPNLTLPAFAAQGALEIQLAGGWTLKNFSAALLQAGDPWLRLTAAGKGNLSRLDNFQLALFQNFSAFARSDLAKRLKLNDTLRGAAQLNLSAQGGDRAHLALELTAENLGVMVEGRMQDFPLAGSANVKFSRVGTELRDLEIDAKLTSPIANVTTVAPLTLPSPSAWQNLRGQIQFNFSTAEVIKRFRATLAALNIGEINEQIAGLLHCADDRYQASLTLTRIDGNPEPLSLNLQLSSPSAPVINFAGTLATANNERLQLQGKISNPATNNADEISGDAVAQAAITLPTLSALYQRFSPLFGGAPLPPMQGGIRGRLDAALTQKSGAAQISLRLNSALENAAVTYQDSTWREPKAQMQGAITVSRRGATAAVVINPLQIRSSSLNLNLTTGALPLDFSATDLPARLDQLPAFNLAVAIGENAWRQIDFILGGKIPRDLFGLDSQLTAQVNYDAAKKLLTVKELSLKTPAKSTAALKEFSLTTAVSNLGDILRSPTPPVIAANLPQGVNIPRAALSVEGLRRGLGVEGNASVRALQGTEIILQNVKLTAAGNRELTLTGIAAGALAFNNNPAKPPLLQLAGNAGFAANRPLKIQLADDRVIAEGALELTDAAVRMNALSPYIYDKPRGKPLQLAFRATQYVNGDAEVASAELNGPLPVSLTNFALRSANNQLAVKLDEARIGAPFNVVAKNLDLDRARDRVGGEIEIGKIDLALLRDFMPDFHALTWTGAFAGARAKIAGPYHALLGAQIEPAKLNGTLAVGSFLLDVTNPQNRARLVAAFAGADFSTARGVFTLTDFTVSNPSFSATPVATIPRISIQPNLATFNQSPMVIREIVLDGLRAVYEKTKDRGTNVEAIQKVLDGLSLPPSASTPAASADAPRIPAAGAAATASSPTLLIQTLSLRNGQAKVIAPGQFGDGMELPLNVELHDITESGAGNIISQIIKSMLGSIIGQTVKSILTMPQLRELVTEQIIGNLGKIADLQIGDLKPLDALKDLGGSGTNLVKDVVGGVLDFGKNSGAKDKAADAANKTGDAAGAAANKTEKILENVGKGALNLLHRDKK